MKKRADGRYCKQVFVGFQENGKRKFKTIYGKTIKEVEKKEIEIKSQLSHDLYVDNDKITIGQWATEWFETYKSGGEHNTVCMYKNSIEKHIIPMIGNLPLSQTKTIQLQKMLNEIVDSGKLRTADVCRLTIKQIMKCAYQERLISRDVTVGLQPIKKDTKEKKVLTKEQISSIEKAPLTDKERLFVEIIRYTGLRKGEALALTIYDIDIDKKKLYVNKSIYFDGNTAKVKDPKSRSGHRIIPIPDVLLYRLKDYIKNINSFRLFTMTTGEYMSKQSFRIFWNHIIEKTRQSAEKLYRQETENNICPIRREMDIDFTPHTFRHTYATNLYYAGVDVKTAQYLMGHSSVDITLKIYTHLDAEKTDMAIDKINRYFA